MLSSTPRSRWLSLLLMTAAPATFLSGQERLVPTALWLRVLARVLNRSNLVACLSLLTLALVSAEPSRADTQLTASDGASFEDFGASVDISGDTVVVGAPGHGALGQPGHVENAGAAYVFVQGVEQAELLDLSGDSGDQFGAAVAIDGNTLVVGAFSKDAPSNSEGAAFVFVRSGTTWSLQQQLAPSDPVDAGNFGYAVDIEGDTILVAAPLADGAVAQAGAAYVFTRSGTTWSEQQKLQSTDGADFDRFGDSVALSGNSALIGAWRDDDAGSSSGSAYVFLRTGVTWAQQQKLTASDAAMSARFGLSVAIDGDSAVIGAPLADIVGTNNEGQAYVFTRSGVTWTEQQILSANDAASSDSFGDSVAILGDRALVGATGAGSTSAPDGGAGYRFERTGTTWAQVAKLNAPDAQNSDDFGISLALDTGGTVVGADLSDGAAVDSGSAYVGPALAVDETKLAASDAQPSDDFGTDVDVSGSTMIVGAPGHGAHVANSGAAYIYESGAFVAELLDGSAASGDQFGFAVAVDGDTAVVSAFNKEIAPGNNNEGAVFVYVKSGGTWSEQQQLTASVRPAGANFGRSVDIDGDTILVGAREDDGIVADAGAAWVFARSGVVWSEQAKLMASDGAGFDDFGYAVSLSGDIAVVGAYRDDDAGSSSGAAYVFERSGTVWAQLMPKLVAPDAAMSDRFGETVAADGDRVVVASAEKGAGKVYIFERSGGSFVFADSLEPESSASNQRFGDAVDVKGSTIVVGATNGDANLINDTGAAHLFTKNGASWQLTRFVSANDASSGDSYGESVAVDGEVAVGAPMKGAEGAAYLYALSCSPIQDRVFVNGQTYVCNDGVGITTLGTVTVQSGASVSLYAPAITLAAGFSVEAGGLFMAGPLGGAPLRTTPERLELGTRAMVTSLEARPLVPRRKPQLLPARRIELGNVPGHLWQILAEAHAEAEDLMTDASGGYIAFATSSPLLEADGNRARDVYLYEIATNQLTLISRSRRQAGGLGDSSQPRIDGAGRGVYFVSRPTESGRAELFHYRIRDQQLVRLTRASSELAGDVSNPATDASGRHYVYQRAFANGAAVVMVGELGSLAGNHSASSAANLLTQDPWSGQISQSSPTISADGQLIAFLERSETEAGLGPCTVAVWDRMRRETRRASCPMELHLSQALPAFIEEDTAIEWQISTGSQSASRERVRMDNPSKPSPF